MFRRLGPALVVALVAAVAVSWVRASHGPEPARARRPPAPGNAYRSCPRLSVSAPGFALTDSALLNLGGHLLGRSSTYRDGSRSLSLHVGEDAIEAIDDLELVGESIPAGERSVTLLRADAPGPGHPLLAARWQERGVPAPCRSAALVGRNVSDAEILDAVAGIVVDRP